MRRTWIGGLLFAGALVAVACSSFSATETPSPSDAGEDATASIADAGAPDAPGSCETVTFDLGAAQIGAGWTKVTPNDAGMVQVVDGGVLAHVDRNRLGTSATLEYRIVHRETLSRVVLHARIAGVVASNQDEWPAIGFFVRDNDVYAGRTQVQRTPDQRAAFVDYPADGGSGVAVLRADLGSFPDTASFALTATLDGVWRDGPTASLVSNGDVAMDDSSPKLQRFPELDDAGAHSLDVAVGVLFSPHGGATIVIQAASLDICR